MKILLIANGYPPHRYAGTEVYTAGIAEGIRRLGYQVQVVCVGAWEIGNQYWNGSCDEEHNGVAIHRLNLNWKKAPDPFRYLYNNSFVEKYLRNYIQIVKPDLVHVTSCETLSASVLKTVKNAGLPLVLSITDFWFLCPRINLMKCNNEICDGLTNEWECLRCQLSDTKIYRWSRRFLGERSVKELLIKISKYPALTRQRGLRGMAGDMEDRKVFLRQAIKWPDCRITASPFVRDIFLKNDISPPILVQPYGHNLAWTKRYAGKTGSHLLRIGFIGQIVKSKGVHLLLKAAQLLEVCSEKKFKILIYGNMKADPAYTSELNALASKLSSVEFCGIYHHDQSSDVFANIDALVVPSLWFDFPLIIYEAFAAKTPVIATRMGGMAESVLEEINGLLFDCGDVQDLSNQLSRIINEPGLLEKLTTGIPEVKTIEEQAIELNEIYKSLIHNDRT